MNRVRTFAFLLLVAVAFPAFAFRARPFSDIRFEGRLSPDSNYFRPEAQAAASDGTDYLVLLREHVKGDPYAQVISQGVPYGPPVLLGHGLGGGVVWTGSNYLVAWQNNNGVYVRAVSRRGALLSEPKLVIAVTAKLFALPHIASNGRRILVTQETDRDFFGVLIDFNGDAIGKAFHPGTGSSNGRYAITGTAYGFAFTLFGLDDVSVVRFDDSMGPMPNALTHVADDGDEKAPYPSYEAVVASNGTDVALIFTDRSHSGPLQSAVVGPGGELLQAPHTLLSAAPPLVNAIWNGSEYVAALTLDSPPDTSRIVIERISRTGEVLEPLLVWSQHREILEIFLPGLIASNGRDYLVSFRGLFVSVPKSSANPTTPAELTQSFEDSQEALSLARGQRDFLAVWREIDRNAVTIRASRVDTKGRYLDGEGIVLDTFPQNSITDFSTSVDSNEENWLVVWAAAGHVRGRRISSEGTLLDPNPIAISTGAGAVVRWGGSSWLVVSNQVDRMASIEVSSAGVAGPVKVIEVPDRTRWSCGSPVLAFDGQQFRVAFALEETISCDGGAGSCQYVSIVTERLSLSGDVYPQSRFLLPADGLHAASASLSLATNGLQELVAYRCLKVVNTFQVVDTIEGLLFNEGDSPAIITIASIKPDARFQNPTATTWDGTSFVVAYLAGDGTVGISHVSRLGVAGGPVTLPRDPSEYTLDVVLPPSSPLAPTTDPMGLVTQHDFYGDASRSGFVFPRDVIDSQLQQLVPVAPVLIKAIGDPTGISLTWQPQDQVLGFEIALRQSDGGERVIGIAAGSASSTHISFGGLTGTALRLRAWNAAGLSAPSPEVQLITPRVRAAAK